MARNQIEFCMLCGEAPCACVKEKNARSVSKPAINTVAKSSAKGILPAGDPVPAPHRTALVETSAAKASSKDDRDFRYAVTLLCTSGMVSAQSVAENTEHLNMSESEVQVLIWKLKRNEWLASLDNPPGTMTP